MKTIVLASTLLFACGCALSPEMKLQYQIVDDVFWEAARECVTPFPHLHVNHIAINGDLTVAVDSGRSQEVPLVADCYWQSIARRVEARRQAALPVPDSLNLKPNVEASIDQ